MDFWPLIIGGLLGLLCLVFAFRSLVRKRLIDDVPTSKAQGVFIGLTELKGTAESDAPLVGYLSGILCVYYSWTIEEQWSRLVVETYTDSQGHVQTRTRTETGWTKIGGARSNAPFYLKDETGIIRILPDGAGVSADTALHKTSSPADPIYYEKGPREAVSDSTHHRRFVENVIPLHANLYVMGQAREREDIVAAEIAKDKNTPIFIISIHPEENVSGTFLWRFWLLAVAGLLVDIAVVGGWGLVSGSLVNEKWWSVSVYAGAAYIVAAITGWVWTVYNSLINLHHMTERGWSQVDVQLKRRHDLILNLVTVVAGNRDYEKETQALVSQLRAQGEVAGGEDLHGTSGVLAAIVERYPDLKAGEAFLKLQTELAGTENRIALARDYFNNIAAFYDTRLEIFPERYVAALAGLHPRPLFGAADFERAPVALKLAE